MTQDRRIKKVKYDGAKVIIHYEVERNEDAIDEYTLSCVDAPTQAFRDAMDNLKTLVHDWTDKLIPSGIEDRISVRGVSFSHKRGIFGGCFCALIKVSTCNSPLVLNMPHKPSEPYSDGGDESVCLTGIESELLCAVCAQAELYLDGERAQMALSLEGE